MSALFVCVSQDQRKPCTWYLPTKINWTEWAWTPLMLCCFKSYFEAGCFPWERFPNYPSLSIRQKHQKKVIPTQVTKYLDICSLMEWREQENTQWRNESLYPIVTTPEAHFRLHSRVLIWCHKELMTLWLAQSSSSSLLPVYAEIDRRKHDFYCPNLSLVESIVIQQPTVCSSLWSGRRMKVISWPFFQMCNCFTQGAVLGSVHLSN